MLTGVIQKLEIPNLTPQNAKATIQPGKMIYVSNLIGNYRWEKL